MGGITFNFYASNSISQIGTLSLAPTSVSEQFDYFKVYYSYATNNLMVVIQGYQNGNLTRQAQYTYPSTSYNDTSKLKIEEFSVREGDTPRRWLCNKGKTQDCYVYSIDTMTYKITADVSLEDYDLSVVCQYNGVSITSASHIIKSGLKGFYLDVQNLQYTYTDYSSTPYAPQYIPLRYGYIPTGNMSIDGTTWVTSFTESDLVGVHVIYIQYTRQVLNKTIEFHNYTASAQTYTYDSIEKTPKSISIVKLTNPLITYDFSCTVTFTNRTTYSFYFNDILLTKNVVGIKINNTKIIEVDRDTECDDVSRIDVLYEDSFDIDNVSIHDDYLNQYKSLKLDEFGTFNTNVFGTGNQTYLNRIKENLSSISGMTPRENIVSYRFYPIDMDNTPLVNKAQETSKVKLFDYDTDAYGLSVRNAQPVEWFTFNVSSNFNDFRDYEPYTLYILHLPFYGDIQLKSEDIVGKTIKAKITLDLTVGNLTLFLYNETSMIYKQNTKIGYDMPMSGNIFNIVKLAMGVTSTITNAVGVGRDVRSIMDGVDVSKNALDGVFNSIKGVNKPTIIKPTESINDLHENFGAYIKRTTIIPVNDAGISEYYGRECKRTIRLGELEGMTVVDNLRINCGTDNERQEIKDLFKKGVIL